MRLALPVWLAVCVAAVPGLAQVSVTQATAGIDPNSEIDMKNSGQDAVLTFFCQPSTRPFRLGSTVCPPARLSPLPHWAPDLRHPSHVKRSR